MGEGRMRVRLEAKRWLRRTVLALWCGALLTGCEPRGTGSPGHPADVEAASPGSSSTASPPSGGGGLATASAAPLPPAPAVELATGGKAAVRGDRGMVASEVSLATRIGADVLRRGGNAIDAAVAVGYALSVTHHAAGSLGGGGFMIVRLASGETHAIDFRETAPAAATRADNDKQLAAGAHGYLSAPVPGVVAGLNLARDRFGTLPLSELIAPSVGLAREGHPYGARPAQVLAWYFKRLRADPVMRAVFGKGSARTEPITRGDRLKQPRLADTLEAIAAQGDAGFYGGPVAEKIARAMKNRGGLVTEKDLADYRAKLREPLRVVHRGLEVFTMPPPSMGGIAVASMLLGLEHSKVHEHEAGSTASLHLFIEAARRAYADRRSVGADPDQMDSDLLDSRLGRLLDPDYVAQRQPSIDPEHATPSSAVVPLQELPEPASESPDTTHYSVVDAQGNAVSCTTTLSAAFGAWVMVPETGVILSNAMGAFSPSGPNALAPGKRMASSMSPVVVVRRGKPVAALGSPGGDTIPGTVAQVLRNLIDHHMTIDAAIEQGRIHHQYRPDVVRLEKLRPPSAAVLAALTTMGHKLQPSPAVLGDVNGIVVDPATGISWGFADTRKGGLALGPDAAAAGGTAR